VNLRRRSFASLRSRWAAIAGVFALLFAQFAFAASPCAGMDMDEGGMDQVAMIVCEGHCQHAQQSLDSPQPPPVIADEAPRALPSAALVTAQHIATADIRRALPAPRPTSPPPLVLLKHLRQ
jgi:hypothetical protein